MTAAPALLRVDPPAPPAAVLPAPAVLAIDPGNEWSAYVLYDAGQRRPVGMRFGKVPNPQMLEIVQTWTYDRLVVEQIASFGMAVGAEVFETVFWSGRFCQAAEARGLPWDRVKRLAVKMHLCHNSRAKDANIRQALIDRYGGKERAIGRKSQPGPLYGVAADVWSALAVAVTWSDCNYGKVNTVGRAL